MPAQHHTLHSLIDEVIVNPQTPEEEALDQARIARVCEQIRAENDAAISAGLRVGHKYHLTGRVQVEANTIRPPKIYKVSMGGNSTAYLGGQ